MFNLFSFNQKRLPRGSRSINIFFLSYNVLEAEVESGELLVLFSYFPDALGYSTVGLELEPGSYLLLRVAILSHLQDLPVCLFKRHKEVPDIHFFRDLIFECAQGIRGLPLYIVL